MDNNLLRLDGAIRAAGIPITGVAGQQNSVHVDFQALATAEQRTQAQLIVDAFDWSGAAYLAWKDGQEPDLAALRNQATQAVADINTFLAIASPNNAQLAAEVKAIDQRQRAIIKALARLTAKMLG